jgi:ANTAR domain
MGTPRSPLASQFAQALADDHTDMPLPQRIGWAARDMAGADGASITVENSTPNRVTLCATDRRADQLEDIQDVLGEGPGMDAYNFGQPVHTGLGDGRAVHRWPQFVPAADEIVGHLGRIWAFPLCSAAQVIGTVTFYRLTGQALARPDPDIETLAGAVVGTLLTDPQAFSELPNSSGWSSRAVVHQATGILIAKLGVGASEALDLLRSYAFFAGNELREVAAEVVEHKLDLTGG